MKLSSVQEVCQAIADGRAIQYRDRRAGLGAAGKWFDLNASKYFWVVVDDNIQWRTKPVVYSYRLALFNVGAVSPLYDIRAIWDVKYEKETESQYNFVKWLSNWQELEIDQ